MSVTQTGYLVFQSVSEWKEHASLIRAKRVQVYLIMAYKANFRGKSLSQSHKTKLNGDD